jgi:alkanesulfonate monooxygenase SsuD/methylene tetrahydromethanopterin reductase-like flavin-dependent oxidoreductase (luciferase family)
LFDHLIRRQVIQRLAGSYPTPRQKEEVPVWICLSSQLSLKLHGAQGYFALTFRHGGLDTSGVRRYVYCSG